MAPGWLYFPEIDTGSRVSGGGNDPQNGRVRGNHQGHATIVEAEGGEVGRERGHSEEILSDVNA